MTVKRFKSILNDIGLRDEITGKDYIYFNPEIVDLVNNLSSENEQLNKQLSEQGSQLDFLKDENRHMRDVLEDNKQLKNELNFWKKQAKHCPMKKGVEYE